MRRAKAIRLRRVDEVFIKRHRLLSLNIIFYGN